MARTPTEVQSDYITEYEAIDPSSSVAMGPIFDFVIRPNSRFISELEEKQDRTDRLTSNDFSAAATDDELERMAAGVGSGLPQGSNATTQQVFGTYSRPKAGVVIQIPQGSIVGTTDGILLYQTTAPAQIDGNFPDVYLNPSRRTYEVLVPIRSVAVGSRYNLPPTRIRNLVSDINGIDFTENPVRLTDGKDPGTVADLVERAQNSLQGQEIGSIGGLQSAVLSAFQENVKSVSVITSADSYLFRRAVTKPGIDIYYAGQVEEEIEVDFVAIGGEITIPIGNAPIIELIQFLVNGTSVSFEVIQDTDPATSGSVLDKTYILLSVPLVPGDAVFMRYKYDSLASAIGLSFGGSNSIFDVDTLVRKSVVKNPKIVMSAKMSSSFSKFSLRTNILDSIVDFFETNEHGAIYLPSVFKDYLRDKVIGIATEPSIEIFQMEDRALLNIEPIELRANEVASINLDTISLDIT